MEPTRIDFPPCRITDLIAFKKRGSTVTCRVSFEILPVDFFHRAHPFQAYIFLSRYSGNIDDREYRFRKCYARGCPHNLCPHVSQAVTIANRYLQRDYRRLEDGGIEIEKRLFSLEDMMVKYGEIHQEYDGVMTVHDYINLAREGNDVVVAVALEYVSAVEHFANHKNAQMFLMVDFSFTRQGKTNHIERCLACYPKEKEEEEKQNKIHIANERLKLLYEQFQWGSVKYEEKYFQ
jgi:hypothetical protein